MLVHSDEELVIAVQSGDIASFEVLVRRYQKRLQYYVHRYVHTDEAAEEVVQDTLFTLYQTIERIDTKRKVKSYIYAIARNMAISYMRRHQVEARIDESVVGGNDADVFDLLWNEEKVQTVRHALSQLSPVYRRALQLYYFDELSYKEVSKKLHIPLNTVRTHLARAKKALKRSMEFV